VVQPGGPGPVNDYRFPSKLPEFLASARPVILPRTNIGLHMEDGVDALLLERGDADEIAEKVALLADDPELRTRLGKRGRAFALRELQWSKSVEHVVDLYQEIASR
jgi:glycosyltransferase involved in cell wall biosynthesis